PLLAALFPFLHVVGAAVSHLLALSLHDALPISQTLLRDTFAMTMLVDIDHISMELSEFVTHMEQVGKEMGLVIHVMHEDIFNSIDRKSTRLNSSHVSISYADFCLKKKT